MDLNSDPLMASEICTACYTACIVWQQQENVGKYELGAWCLVHRLIGSVKDSPHNLEPGVFGNAFVVIVDLRELTGKQVDFGNSPQELSYRPNTKFQIWEESPETPSGETLTFNYERPH